MISYIANIFTNLIIAYYTIIMVFRLLFGDFDLFSANYSTDIQISKNIDVKFKDVIGLKNVKKDLIQYINYMNNREQYTASGYKIPKGVIFSGPPGTGKTMLSKAMAGETNATFIFISGSDFIEIFVGVGSKRVRELFKKARENKPAIVFIDELDSIGGQRNNNYSNSEHNSTLNQLLEEMDGFKDNDGILVIAATNMYDSLDPALKRSGRFDRKIVFDRPNLEEREKMFDLYLNKVKLAPIFLRNKETNIKKLARLTSSITGADIANIANQSACNYINRKYPIILEEDINTTNLIPIDNDNDGVIFEDLIKSIDEVTVGMEKRERLLSEKEKHIVAYHEAGHSLVAYMMKDTRPPIKISIIPRGDAALGYSLQEPIDQKLHQYEELLAILCVLIGGRLGEKIKFNRISTGAYDDLQKMTQIAYQIITVYGMNKRLGPMNLNVQNKESMLENLSDVRKNEIDNEVQKMISYITDYTEELLRNNVQHLETLAKYLIEHEEMTTYEIDKMLGDTKILDSVEVPSKYL
jgi:AFG3 family protein